jgi:hypothetical protein
MKSDWTKANRFKAAGILFLASAVVWFLAGVIGRQPVFSGVGAVFISVGISYISQSKKTATRCPNSIDKLARETNATRYPKSS